MEKIYKIASINLPNFETRLEFINKKAKKLGLPEVGYREICREHVPARDYYDVAGTDEPAHPAFDLITVSLYGEAPYIRGWRLMGVLEHTPDFEFPLLHNVPGCRIPENYWTDKSRHCDHCNSRRNRKDTFILQNVQTLEYRQIGRQCLADFLPGITPEDALRYSLFYRSINTCLDDDYDQPDFNNQTKWDYAEYDLINVLAISSAVIRVDGWLSSTKAREQEHGETTGSSVRTLLKPRTNFMKRQELDEFNAWAMKRKPTEGDFAIAAKVLAWIRSESFEATTEYAHNLKVIAMKGATNNRNVNISVSAIPAYLRFMDQQHQLNKNKETCVNEWVGQKGERLRGLSLEVQSTRSLESVFGVTTLINFRDADGRLVTWFASTPVEVQRGERYTVTGTVKKLETFNGAKQTILTRCKIEKTKEVALAE